MPKKQSLFDQSNFSAFTNTDFLASFSVPALTWLGFGQSGNAIEASVKALDDSADHAPIQSAKFQALIAPRATNNFPPDVVGIDQKVELNDKIRASRIFRASDLDGNPITRVRFYDSGALATSGHFEVDGVEKTARQWFEVAAADLSKVIYQAGTVRGSETVNFRVYDGQFWSNMGSALLSSIPVNSKKPRVSTTDTSVLAYEKSLIGDSFRASDPEGGDIVKYRIRDVSKTSGNGGYFEINGKKKVQGRFFSFTDKNALVYVGRLSKQTVSEQIEVRAFDGKLWSDIETFNVTTIGNKSAPLVTTRDIELGVDQTLPSEGLFSVSDPDGNSIKKYRFFDTGVLTDGGHFTVNGVRQDPLKWFQVSADQLSTVVYHSAKTADREQLRVQAFDGLYWSRASRFNSFTLQLPVLNVDPVHVVDEVQRINVQSIVSRADNGPATVYYEVYDSNARPTSAYFELGGPSGNRDLPANQIHRISASQLNALRVQAGKSDYAREFDEFYIRANNGFYTGPWSRFQVSTETIGPRAVDSPASWYTNPGEGGTITYSFLLKVPDYYDDTTPEFAGQGTFTTLNPDMRDGVRYALNAWAAVTGLSFEEVTDTVTGTVGPTGGIMRFGSYAIDGAAAYAYFPDPSKRNDTPAGDVWFDSETFPYVFTGAPDTFDMTLGDDGILIAIHEIGHAIGLSHSFDEQDGQVFLHPLTENNRYSVMSYTQLTDVAGNIADPITPMIYDIMLAQIKYGAETKINRIDTTWSYESNETFVKTIWDPDGHDHLDLSNYTKDGTIDLRQGTWSSIGGRTENLFMTYGTIIEDVTGGRGNESITGNEADNVIDGGFGNDTLSSGGGSDTMIGGNGSDNYIYKQADGNDIIQEDGGGGRERLQIWGFDGINKLHEDLTFRRLGNDLRIDLTVNGTPSQGSITIKDMGVRDSRVETLSLHRQAGSQIGLDIDLQSIFTNATNAPQQFKLTTFSSGFGFLAVPV